MNTEKTVKRFVSQDAETVPLPPLEALSMRIKPHGLRQRLPQTEAILRERPKEQNAAELYLNELIMRSLRQHGGSLHLNDVFGIAVSGISKETAEALPDHTQTALYRLARLVMDEPIDAPEPRLLAHALSIDGKLVGWLTSKQRKAA